MLKFWHVSFLVLIALIWKVRPAYASMDICDLGMSNVSMYCSCDTVYRHGLEITCYVLGPMSPTSEVWSAFRKHENTVAFTLQPRISTHLEFVPIRALQNLPSLETLTIQEAMLKSLQSGDISDMPNLRNLRLERNEIASVERYAISNLPKLKKLTLSENAITEILADSLTGLDDLEELYLDRNNISTIEGCAFCNLHSLKELELWRNSITDLTDRTFLGLRYLRRLDLFNNGLKVLKDKVFQTVPRLVELDLKNNRINYISPQAFNGLNHLTILRLSNNEIKTLPDEIFYPLPKLMSLDLSFNEIETLQTEVMEGLHNSLNNHFTFTFKSNPLRCNCDFSWLSRWVHKAKNSRFGQELLQAKCRDSEGEEKLIHDLKIKPCPKSSKKTKITHEPTVATVHSHSTKHHTSLNPKYDSEYADDVQNRTYSVTVQPLHDPGGTGCIITGNAMLSLCTTIGLLAFFWT